VQVYRDSNKITNKLDVWNDYAVIPLHTLNT